MGAHVDVYIEQIEGDDGAIVQKEGREILAAVNAAGLEGFDMIAI